MADEITKVRGAEWGHWGITFWTRDFPDQYAPSEINGRVMFPVGNRGPVDLPRRDEYRAMIAAWRDHGTLPAGAL